MNVLAIVGSRRVGSYNLQAAQAAGELLKQRRPDVTFTILNWDDVPFMNEDSEHLEPPAIARVRQAVRDADGVWLFSPEYNHAIPRPLKNLLDWLSRPVSATEGPVIVGKPVALSGASIGMSGAEHAQEQLAGMLNYLNARVMNKPRLCIPYVGSQAQDGVLKLDASAPYLERQADAFVRFIEAAR